MVKLQASRGVPEAGVSETSFGAMERLAMLVKKERRVINLHNVRSQFRYLHSIRSDGYDDTFAIPVTEASPTHYLAFPLLAYDSVVGVICVEDPGERFKDNGSEDERYFSILSRKLGEALHALPSVADNEREALFKQAIERARLQWEKESNPFYTILSARERQVAVNVARGYTNAEIARQLFISLRTVTTHLERIYQKLNIPSRAALTRYVVEMGLLAEEPEQGE